MISNFLTEAGVGNVATEAQAMARKQINERWEKAGFTTGLVGYMKETMSTLFENQATAFLNESTDAQNSGSFETVVFPLVRRVFSRLLANDIVSVQAMNLPIGKLFFILPKTSERRWTDASGQPITNFAELDTLDGVQGSHYGLMGYERKDRTGNTAKYGENGSYNRYYLPDEAINDIDVTGKTPEVTQYFKKSLYDMFYNDGLYDASKGRITIKTGEVQNAFIAFNGETIVSTGTPKFKVDEQGSVRHLMIAVKGFSSVNAGRLIGPDGNEMDTETFLASLKVFAGTSMTEGADSGFTCFQQFEPLAFRVVTQKYGHGIVDYQDICNADGSIILDVDLTKPCKEAGKTIDGYIGVAKESVGSDIATLINVAWAQYDSLELETEMGEVSFELTNVVVSAEPRKLRATWSPELAQDVAAFHNIDAEAELTAILSEQIAAEIDREILKDLRTTPFQLKWDYNGWRRQAGFSTNYTQKDWNQTLMTKINQISAQIHKATLRGGANFVVVSTEVSAVLNDLEYFHVTDANSEAVQYSMGIEKIGSLQGRYQVYVDPYSPAYSVIVGHKGDSLLDTGYIYAPYVPMQLTPVIYNPFNFAPIRGIMTRYAKKMVNNRFYGNIICNGLQTWNIAELR